jgi:acetolactate synthase-1/2/3 large subunit
MKTCNLVARILHERGVKVVFGMTGGMITFLVDALVRRGKTRFITFHHEQSAAFAADAYGRMTGIPGVAMATSGPGATNLITGIGGCYFDSAPAVFITGQVSRKDLKGGRAVRQLGFQETDIVTVARSLTKSAVMVDDPSRCASALVEAFDLALDGRPGPVLLDIPIDVQKEEVMESKVTGAARRIDKGKDVSGFIGRLSAALRVARRPLVLVGGGVRASLSQTLLLDFLKRSRLPVVYSLLGVDVLDAEHSQRVGMIGSYGNRYANIAVKESDLLIVLGSRLDIRQTGTDVESFREGKKIFHVDLEQAELNNRIKSCDACRCALNHFLAEFSKSGKVVATDIQSWRARLAALIAEYPDAQEQSSAEDGINPNAFIAQLSDAATVACGYAVDVGQHQMWAAQSIRLRRGQRFITSGGMGAMGFALPAAIGMAFAVPAKPVVVIAGDGAFQVNIQELETIRRHHLPVKIVVINNHSLGMVRQFQDEVLDGRREGTVRGYSAPDFARIAKAYGIPAKVVRRSTQVPSVLAWLMQDTKSPALLQVDIAMTRNVNPKIQFGRPIHQMEPLIPEGRQVKSKRRQ